MVASHLAGLCVKTAIRVALACGLACALLTACSITTAPGDDGNARSLARAESAFSDAAKTTGVKAAFLDAMSDDAILFRPGPVNGKAFTAKQPDPPIQLEWHSQRVSVSASGELGYSSGPYRLNANNAPDKPSFGQFFTVWKRNDAGRWQVLIDQGIWHADPLGWRAPLEIVERDRGSPPSATIANEDARFAEVSRSNGLLDAYRAFASTRVRVLRDDRAPIDGLAALDALPTPTAHWAWTLTDSGVARSGDLAWTMGRYRSEGDARSTSGYYVRVWRAEGGTWKILTDVLAPIDHATH
jgi:ketosteroid isomerase-like protein